MKTGVKRLLAMALAMLIGFGVYRAVGASAAAVPQAAIEIKTPQDLDNVRNNLAGDYILAADITLSGNFTPIGTEDAPFTGTFDGNWKTIYGLKIESTDADTFYGGLFGYIEEATVKNVGIIGADIAVVAKTARVGGVAGSAASSTISNCIFFGQIQMGMAAGSNYAYSLRAGGIACMADATTISDCTLIVSINAPNLIGIFGYAPQVIAGGVVAGADNSAAIKNCLSMGIIDIHEDMTGNGAYYTSQHIGGITGFLQNSSSIDQCSSAVAIRAASSHYASAINVGGLAGVAQISSSIKDSYNVGLVITSTKEAGRLYLNQGGLVGTIGGATTNITNCFNFGSVTYDIMSTFPGGSDPRPSVLALFGRATNADIQNCYGTSIDRSISYDGSGNSFYGGVPAGTPTCAFLTNEQFKQQASFTGFDFTNVWTMSDNYPDLRKVGANGTTPIEPPTTTEAPTTTTTIQPPPPSNKTIFSTGYEATPLNWVLFFVLFGWIWMWFI